MSWDLEVFASGRPEPGDRAEELDARGVSVDGPLEVEDEDLPEAVAAALLVCRWTVQISVPAGSPKAALRDARRLARALARESSGLVYDPQEDAIVWPRSVKRLREPVASRDRDEGGRKLELRWLVARRLDARDGHALVDILERDLPEALPRRFGDYEPLQGRLERDGAGAFAVLWDGDDGPFWYGRRPFDFGSVWLRRGWGSALTAEGRDALTPMLGGRKATEVDAIALAFRDDVVHDDRWLDALTRLFVRVAEHYSPFFAGAHLRDEFGEPALLGRWWLGVPDAPLWLTWIGSAYLPHLPDRLPEHAERSGDHVLLRAPGAPDDAEALRLNRIEWRPELMRRGAHDQDHLAAAVIPALG